MGIVCYYCAQSLDGYLADPHEGIEWLTSFDLGEEVPLTEPQHHMFDYRTIINHFEAIAMGSKTYDYLLNVMKENPYAPRRSVVFTSRGDQYKKLPAIEFVNDRELRTLSEMREKYSRTWLLGGGDLARQAMALDLVDEIILTIIPKTIGGGAPVFYEGESRLQDWNLIEVGKTTGGAVQLYYTRENKS